ncbi:uncharacterized protein UDID_18822 [Ustilago sp. UG-2017a]|nr:uncharacterized protein UDID_18822 [Ustilago sp. UG-2017a]
MFFLTRIPLLPLLSLPTNAALTSNVPTPPNPPIHPDLELQSALRLTESHFSLPPYHFRETYLLPDDHIPWFDAHISNPHSWFHLLETHGDCALYTSPWGIHYQGEEEGRKNVLLFNVHRTDRVAAVGFARIPDGGGLWE